MSRNQPRRPAPPPAPVRWAALCALLLCLWSAPAASDGMVPTGAASAAPPTTSTAGAGDAGEPAPLRMEQRMAPNREVGDDMSDMLARLQRMAGTIDELRRLLEAWPSAQPVQAPPDSAASPRAVPPVSLPKAAPAPAPRQHGMSWLEALLTSLVVLAALTIARLLTLLRRCRRQVFQQVYPTH